MSLETKIEYLPSVGPKTAKKLLKLGIETVNDLLFAFPRRYEDYTTITKISEIAEKLSNDFRGAQDSVFTIKGSVLGIANKKTRRRHFTVTEGVVVDDTGSIKVVWFNQPYLAKMLKTGSEIILNGRVTFDRFSNTFAMESPNRANYPKIVPIYPVTAGITTFFMAKLFRTVRSYAAELEDILPSEIKRECNLVDLHKAILSLHEPDNLHTLENAERRLAFDELFLISLRSNLINLEIKKAESIPIKIEPSIINKFLAKLPFKLTGDQERAITEIIMDLAKISPMNRLLNGDVGSGKTVVAAIAAYITAKAGFKTVIMAPTEILATQHYNTFCQLFKDLGISIGLMTSNRQEVNTESGIPNIEKSKTQYLKLNILNSNVLIGTSALIQPGIKLENVGLVIVDEQHRFGVKQRAALQSGVRSQEPGAGSRESCVKDALQPPNSKLPTQFSPHFLSMTATPIPRTLQLALFGDLDVSLITEKPANRKEIKTRLVEPFNRDKAYEFIRSHLKTGRQVFIICPLIEESGVRSQESGEDTPNSQLLSPDFWEEERKSVKAEYEKLQKIFPEFSIGMLHGKLKAAEKDRAMSDFSVGETQLLVSTSVVEVGVDIPNATVMMIEDAERFGLAQIHQFRGRVGRGDHQSFCLLFSASNSPKVIARLKSLEQVSDGFKLAQVDLETRGPGAVFGTKQSGLLDLKMASLSDQKLIIEASSMAKKIALEITKYPTLIQKLSQFEINKHLE